MWLIAPMLDYLPELSELGKCQGVEVKVFKVIVSIFSSEVKFISSL